MTRFQVWIVAILVTALFIVPGVAAGVFLLGSSDSGPRTERHPQVLEVVGDAFRRKRPNSVKVESVCVAFNDGWTAAEIAEAAGARTAAGRKLSPSYYAELDDQFCGTLSR